VIRELDCEALAADLPAELDLVDPVLDIVCQVAAAGERPPDDEEHRTFPARFATSLVTAQRPEDSWRSNSKGLVLSILAPLDAGEPHALDDKRHRGGAGRLQLNAVIGEHRLDRLDVCFYPLG
jgi:hypothetical protein